MSIFNEIRREDMEHLLGSPHYIIHTRHFEEKMGALSVRLGTTGPPSYNQDIRLPYHGGL